MFFFFSGVGGGGGGGVFLPGPTQAQKIAGVLKFPI